MVKNKVGIIIQARMGSSRLPAKIALKLPYSGELSVIEHIIARSKAVNPDYLIAVATSVNAENDLLAAMTSQQGVVLFRGDEEDVLSRYAAITQQYQLDTIVRLTGDNPCIDPVYIEKAIEEHATHKADYTYTQGLPLGMNVEVVSNTALQIAHEQGIDQNEREHVTYFVRQRPDQFVLHYPQVLSDEQDCAQYRLTLDTPSDYALMCLLYQQLYSHNHLFGFNEIMEFFKENPWVKAINQDVFQKNAYQSFEEEKADALELLAKNGFMYTIKHLKDA
ncbi:glycosyltransferase family protein [Microscilla marina]|uniref:Spore coat polysaccharide biosynthesis protein SpsF, putative n=1 Tax=Microscilla marina ATCC 23134 TaxID=313606 RepID=A1ZCJ7_MICM2|nr:glycosyltransferase family protein [Microscilla marina]EAY31999.1 spore coat polysaccharide biosynthesis protein SpsF, putative [Microscilla marina ATCC 23134]